MPSKQLCVIYLQDNTLDFLEYVAALHLILRGNLEDRLKWSFKMYDKDGNGKLDRQEVKRIIRVRDSMSDIRELLLSFIWHVMSEEESEQRDITLMFHNTDPLKTDYSSAPVARLRVGYVLQVHGALEKGWMVSGAILEVNIFSVLNGKLLKAEPQN